MDFIILAIVILSSIIGGIFFLFVSFYKKVDQGFAMIVNTLRKEPDVTFTGRLVVPVIHRKEIMSISLKTIEIDRRGKDGLICKDNIRADIKVAFFVRVNKTQQDVLKVAQAIGCERASDQETLEELFNAKFSEALKTVGKRMDFIELYQERDKFRDDIIKVIGEDLNGYVLEDAAIDYLEQTPIEQLDADNILDAQGIRKITELTAIEHISTNDLRREEEMRIKKKDVETEETLLELERQRADAEAKQQREIATVKAREKAEQEKIEAEEQLKSESARIQKEQSLAIQEENKLREVQVAEHNRLRVIAVETEQVERTKQLERVQRQRAVELETIEKEKALEEQRKNIADVIRERVSVEKTVAIEEEEIEKVRVIAEAERQKQSKIIHAEAMAEENLVKEIKSAEAEEIKATHKAKEELVLAEGHLKASELDAQAKLKQAEGIEAIEAASGLAKVKVEEAEADALEKMGFAEARVTQQRLQAEAIGKEQIGLADAKVIREKLEAEASGKEKIGLADVKVKKEEASAIELAGVAEAKTIEARYAAESKGLQEKFNAMKEMDDHTRSHEEFRIGLELDHEARMKQIDANVNIAHDQAQLLAKALSDANIDIVGGSGEYFERFVNALAVGKSIDGVVDRSDTVKKVFNDYLQGDASLVSDFKELAASLGNGSESLQNLSVSAFLTKLMTQGTDEQKGLLRQLISSAGSNSGSVN